MEQWVLQKGDVILALAIAFESLLKKIDAERAKLVAKAALDLRIELEQFQIKQSNQSNFRKSAVARSPWTEF